MPGTGGRRTRGAFALVAVLVSAACGAHAPIDRRANATSPCRQTVALVADQQVPTVSWVSPPAAAERAVIERWCEAVGPAVVGVPAAAGLAPPDDSVAIVSWNVHVGGGAVRAFVRDLRAGRYSRGRPVTDFVILLQEAYRHDPRVPDVTTGAGLAAAIVSGTNDAPRTDVVEAARELGLSFWYVPSMRNGPDDEDRGNAILSTFPLESLTAVELPFERQRRVALAATVRGRSSSGAPWSVRVVNTHLDNLGALRHAWVLSGPARARQVSALLAALPAGEPTVLGGDLNTWFGSWDPAYRVLASRFRKRHPTDPRATFLGLLRLDHLFLDLPDGWRARVERLDDRLGSDHYPIVAWVDATGGGRSPAGLAGAH